jgi:very-short-patch-repair endonuclease
MPSGYRMDGSYSGCIFLKGMTPWDKGMKFDSNYLRRHRVGFQIGHPTFISRKTYKLKGMRMRGKNHPFFGKHHTYASRKLISEHLKGVNHPFYGKHFTLEHRKAISNALKNLPNETKHAFLVKRSPSKLESKVFRIIKKYDLPFTFVGNGNFFIGRKNPDFIHNSKKIVIEVFCRGHKEFFRDGCKRWISSRRRYFLRFGWKTIFIERDEVSEKNILRKVV